MAKDVITTIFEFDVERNDSLEKLVREKQSAGNYPDHFELPLGLQFELTARCNLKCKHCYNLSGDPSSITTMTPEDWLNLAKYLVKNGGLFQCIISGGEPLLLGDKLIPIMDTLHEDDTCFIFITNGFLLDKEWVGKLKKYYYNWFQISIDGHTPELHDEFRGVKGSFERAVRGAAEIASIGIHLRIAHIVSKSTMNYIDKMVDLAYKIGASSVILGEPTESGRTFSHKDETSFTPEEREKVYTDIGKMSMAYEGRMEVLRSSFVKNQLRYYQIQPNSVAVIRPDGNVRLDCMAPFVIGNVKERPFIDIWREKSAECWQNEKVAEYVNSIEGDRSYSCMLQNYIDKDILI
jgi:MoaA/NifB/PqqE/SkfB family radical SAM enzyme